MSATDSPPSAPVPASGPPAQGARAVRNLVIVMVIVVAVAVSLTAIVISLEISADFGCGGGKVYQGHQVCIQDVLPAVVAYGGSLPSAEATCPSVVALNASFHCWLNLTSTASEPQNLTNLTAGGSGNPFTLLSVSNPLPLTMGPGQVAVEELTIRAPSAAGAYNLLLTAQVAPAR
ncbi:MAG TPA: hypothetical protein VEH28_01660 [Thermoplasmata archaeon]|nr:hypothetical protein [Thermoplasmata archaeon]